MTTTATRFNINGMNKSACEALLREFGVQRDWARVKIGEMKAMLRSYSDDRLFAAVKVIVEREGDEYQRSDFETGDDDDDQGDVLTAEAPKTTPAPTPAPTAPPVAATPVAQAVAAVAAPSAAPAVAPNVNEVAELLARLMASGGKPLDVEQVGKIAESVANTVAAQSERNVINRMEDALMTLRTSMVDTLKEVDVSGQINAALANMPARKLEVTSNGKTVVIEGLQHKCFETLLMCCGARKADGNRHNIWLYGPPGTGKTTGARNVSRALDAPFYCTGALLTKYDITGFVDANGKLVRTPFREAWEHGGVYLFDEIDGSAPAAVVAFNAALANGIMAFPDGMIERHPDCIVIAAANTTGLGATSEFTGRMKLDLATLDRFEFLEWPIDESIEQAMATDTAWCKYVQKVRANVATKGIKNVAVTPRATIAGCSLIAQGIPLDMVKAMTLKKSMSAEQWAMVA